MKDGRWETNKKRPEDEEVTKEKIVENIMLTEEEKEYIGQQEVNKKTAKMKKINKHEKITKALAGRHRIVLQRNEKPDDKVNK